MKTKEKCATENVSFVLKKTKPKQNIILKFFKCHVDHSRGQLVTWMKVAHCLLLSQSRVCPLNLSKNWPDSDWSSAYAKAAFFTLILCQDLLAVVTWILDCYPAKEAKTVHLLSSSLSAGWFGTHTTACPLCPSCRPLSAGQSWAGGPGSVYAPAAAQQGCLEEALLDPRCCIPLGNGFSPRDPLGPMTI